jgi:hypothetical protein
MMLQLRELALQDARRALAAAIARQSAAEAVLAQATRAVASREVEAMRSTNDEDVEAFAYWLPEGRRAVRQAGAQVTVAAAATTGARAALSLARAAVRAEAQQAAGFALHPDKR